MVLRRQNIRSLNSDKKDWYEPSRYYNDLKALSRGPAGVRLPSLEPQVAVRPPPCDYVTQQRVIARMRGVDLDGAYISTRGPAEKSTPRVNYLQVSGRDSKKKILLDYEEYCIKNL